MNIGIQLLLLYHMTIDSVLKVIVCELTGVGS